jgi:hypothetical protein
MQTVTSPVTAQIAPTILLGLDPNACRRWGVWPGIASNSDH